MSFTQQAGKTKCADCGKQVWPSPMNAAKWLNHHPQCPKYGKKP